MCRCDGERWAEMLERVLRWSRERDYAGYSKHDALNSPFLHACALDNRLLRLVITQAVMRSPVNIRPLLGVPRERNPKGIGLFAHALLDLAAGAGTPAERDARAAEAGDLLGWLVRHASPAAPGSPDLGEAFGGGGGPPPATAAGPARLVGLGWGYHYPWQDQGFFQPRHFPNRVVSSWIGFAFLRAFEVTGQVRALRVCREIARFLTLNPRALYEDGEALCLSYVPLQDIDWAVMDVSALAAAFLARYAACLRTAGSAFPSGGSSGDDPAELLATARRLMRFVVDRQTPYGAWFYTWPANASRIKHDNYHTAIILDCLADFMTCARDAGWEPVYRKGLEYYREALFLPDGAPRWMNDRTFPHDVHGAASGILCFTRAADFYGEPAGAHAEQADRILRWAETRLYDPRGFFRYQRTRWFTKRFCLMRWGNAWMSRALASRLLLAGRTAAEGRPTPPPAPR